MPDRRTHRGAHPEDARLFTPEAQPLLRAATADVCWLLDRGYAHDSTLKLVGDRYSLLARQRTAVSRCCCTEAAAARRRAHEVGLEQLAGAELWLDGYNVLTTIEAALAGGVILAARDGAYRDMASMHGSYRRVAETVPALELLGRTLGDFGVSECRWLLDRPVSNSGRLKGIIEQLAAARGWPWRVELARDPDVLLADPAAGGIAPPVGAAVQLPPQQTLQRQPQRAVVVVTADSAILDRCPAWFNLARETVCRHVPSATVVDMTAT
jgi:hypothetical protein